MPIDLFSELIELRRGILSMAAAVEERVTLAIDALLTRDEAIAIRVRTGDDEIDQMELDLEQECLRVLALSHPVAGDLRFVLAVMRINTELERVADLAASMAKRAMALNRLPPIDFPSAVLTMADETKRMFSAAINSLAEEETAAARRIRQSDQRVDDLLKEVFAWAQEEIPRNVDATAATLDILSVARKIERTADIATNIAEEVIFLVEGSVVRHSK